MKIKEQNNNDLDEFFLSTRIDIEKKITDTVRDKQILEILKGGKRLRSLLAALAFKACTQGNETNDKYQDALLGSVGIELAHGASLVHDDIIDRDKYRRGKKAYHIKEGVGKAILTGHKMLVQGFEIALKHGKEWANLYVDSWNEVVNGEIDEVEFNQYKNGINLNFSKDDIFRAYNKIIDMKTAALFSSSCKAGALGANMTGDILKVFADYGREIGLAYQLADDLVDLANGEMIDSVIVPILNRLENSEIKFSKFRQREIKRKVTKNKDKIQEIYIKEIQKHVENAQKISKSNLIPSSKYKDLLIEAPRYIVNKMLKEIEVTI